MTYVSQCDIIKYNSQTQTHNVGPPILIRLKVAMVVQQPRTGVRVEWKWGSYIPTGWASIRCEPSPPNPRTQSIFGWTGGPHINCSQTVPCLVNCTGCSQLG